MAIVHIPDELFKKLHCIANGMAMQGNRGTASPFFYQVREQERIYGFDPRWDYDGKVLIPSDGGQSIETSRDEMIMELQVLGEDIDFSKRTDDDLKSILIDGYDYEEGFFRNQHVFTNAFLTEKACKEHITRNIHHYTKPVDYLQYANDNSEMMTVIEFFSLLASQLVEFTPDGYLPQENYLPQKDVFEEMLIEA